MHDESAHGKASTRMGGGRDFAGGSKKLFVARKVVDSGSVSGGGGRDMDGDDIDSTLDKGESSKQPTVNKWFCNI